MRNLSDSSIAPQGRLARTIYTPFNMSNKPEGRLARTIYTSLTSLTFSPHTEGTSLHQEALVPPLPIDEFYRVPSHVYNFDRWTKLGRALPHMHRFLWYPGILALLLSHGMLDACDVMECESARVSVGWAEQQGGLLLAGLNGLGLMGLTEDYLSPVTCYI